MQTERLLKILACPQCHGDLRCEGEIDNPTGFVCERCALVFPIEDSIPVMLLNRAIPLKDRSKTTRDS